MRTREAFIAAVHALVEEFKTNGRIVIVGASLAGLRAAEALRAEGFRGHLTIIGDEPYEPYDRPPLSKQVLEGWVPADHTTLPHQRAIAADRRLGVAAGGRDRAAEVGRAAHGGARPCERGACARGGRAGEWDEPAGAAVGGGFRRRAGDDAPGRQGALAAGPARVLIIFAGFIG